MMIAPFLVLVHFALPKILNLTKLEEDIKEGSFLFSVFMIPAAFIFQFTAVLSRYLYVNGYAHKVTFVASMIGFGVHLVVLSIYSGKDSINLETLALATTFGFIAKILVMFVV